MQKVAPEQLWLQKQRAEIRARAEALKIGGEQALDQLIEKYVPNVVIAGKIRAMQLYDIVRLSGAAIEFSSNQFLTEAAKLSWGYRPTTLTLIGVESGHIAPVVEFQESAILARRVGRRLRAALRIEKLEETSNLRYGVATSPALIPIFGDIKKAVDEHFRSIRRAAKSAAQFGYTLLMRSTELKLSIMGCNLHSNLLWRGTGAFPREEVEHSLGARHEDLAVYDLVGLSKYMTKMPICEAEGVSGQNLLHDPAVATWLHESLKGRRLLTFQRVIGKGNRLDSESEPEIDALDGHPAASAGAKRNKRIISPGNRRVKGQIIAGGDEQERNGRLTNSGAGDLQKLDGSICDDVQSKDERIRKLRAISEKNRKAIENMVGKSAENTIIKIKGASIFLSGLVERVLVIGSYTTSPKSPIGKHNLRKIEAIISARGCEHSSLDNKRRIIKSRNYTPAGGVMRTLRGRSSVIDLSILDKPFDPGVPPPPSAGESCFAEWKRDVDRLRRQHTRLVEKAWLSARAQWHSRGGG